MQTGVDLYERFKAYNPAQARYPKGHPRGGEWKKGGGGLASMDLQSITGVINVASDGFSAEDRDLLQMAVGALASVHRLPAFLYDSLQVRSQNSGFESAGTYYSGERAIGIRPGGTHQPLTLIHEFGHFIDYTAGGMSGIFGATGLGAMSRSLYNAVHEASAKTKLFSELRDSNRTGIFRGINFGHEFMRYLFAKNEMWARMYTQYIVRRARGSGADTLRGLFKPQLKKYESTFWKDKDFGPIDSALDELFESWR